MRINPSARFSPPGESSTAAESRKGAATSRGEGSVDGEADGGELDGEADGGAGRFRGGGRSCFSVFIDGIEERTDYLQLRALCAKFGEVFNLFVQRQRKVGRAFRFGFARYGVREQALKAVQGLDGFKLGSSTLSVAMARFPRVAGSVSSNKSWGSQVGSEQGKRSLQRKVGVSPHTLLSWKDIVLGNRKVSYSSSFSENELRLFDDVGCFVAEGTRIPDRFLFPEISGLGSGLAGGNREIIGRDEDLFVCLAPGSVGKVRRFRDGLVAGKATVAEEVLGGVNSVSTLPVVQGLWENGLFSILLQGPPAGRWSRSFHCRADLCSSLRFAPSLLSLCVGLRKLVVPRTIPPLNLFSVVKRAGCGCLVSTISFEQVVAGSGAAAGIASPHLFAPLILPEPVPPSGLALSVGDEEGVGSSQEIGLDVVCPVQRPRRRGRPKKAPSFCQMPPAVEEVQVELVEGILPASPLLLSDSDQSCGGRYFTRSKKTWLVGKVLGLEFEGKDLDAIRGLEKVYEDHFRS